MSDRLDGLVAMITGCSGGLGRSVVARLDADGANVVGVDIDPTGWDDVEPRLLNDSLLIHADIAREEDVMRAVRDTLGEFARVDILINNAAVQITKPLHETTVDEWDAVHAVNLRGAFLCSREVIRWMLTAKRPGAIVNVSSVLAFVGDAALPAYGASKGGMVALTKSLATAYGPMGIRSNAVCPGDINTPMVDAYFASQKAPALARSRITEEYPLKRIASTDEIASVISFLASDDAGFVNGHSLIVDGGLLADCY